MGEDCCSSSRYLDLHVFFCSTHCRLGSLAELQQQMREVGQKLMGSVKTLEIQMLKNPAYGKYKFLVKGLTLESIAKFECFLDFV